ncbi:MAG TPA: acyltransferase [Candidatus Eisenbacteria bacterium]|jgi:acetyltransferase-like isoleucine patch superfamily enzyme|nr:acyltransferase [Candidatus Eisenbacteria bacterium]
MGPATKATRRLFFLFFRLWHGASVSEAGRNYAGPGLWRVRGGRMRIGGGNVFEGGCDVEVRGTLEIGDRNYFNRGVKIACLGRVTVGSDCLIADSVHFYDHDHRSDDPRLPIRDQGYVSAPIEIGDGVWIGAKATVLKGVRIGDGAIVAAGSVVTRDVPDFAVAAGCPARVVRHRPERAPGFLSERMVAR